MGQSNEAALTLMVDVRAAVAVLVVALAGDTAVLPRHLPFVADAELGDVLGESLLGGATTSATTSTGHSERALEVVASVAVDEARPSLLPLGSSDGDRLPSLDALHDVELDL